MKRIFIPAIIALSFASCQKDVETDFRGTSTGGGTTTPVTPGTPAPVGVGNISVKIDGKVTTFNNSALAMKTSVQGISAFSIIGFQGTPAASDQISITVFSSSVPTPGVYLYDALSPTNTANLGFVKAGASELWASFVSATNPTRITVTSVTASNIAGTFSGDVFKLDFVTGVQGSKKSYTEGSFNVKVQ